MLQEAIVELEELIRLNSHSRHNTLSFDGHSKHVLADTLEVDNQHHVIYVRHARNELNHDLCATVFGQATTVVLDVELVLE